MQRYFGLSQDTAGNIIPSVAVTVKLAGTGTLATVYSSNAYAALANPFTSDTDGTYEFYAQNGRYDITLVKAGFAFDVTNSSDVVLYDPSSIITPAQITGDQNDYNPTNSANASIWRVASDASGRLVSGIVAGRNGQILTLTNVGAFMLILEQNNLNSSAGNRFSFSTARSLPLFANTSVTLYYDTTSAVWRNVAPINPMVGVITTNSGAVTVSASVAETTVFTTVIPGNGFNIALGALATLIFRQTDTVGANDVSIRLKYAGATLATLIPPSLNAAAYALSVAAHLVGSTAGTGRFEFSGRRVNTIGSQQGIMFVATGTFVASAADQNLDVTVQHTAATTSTTMDRAVLVYEF